MKRIFLAILYTIILIPFVLNAQSNNVGIGTTSPGSKLEIIGNGTNTSATSSLNVADSLGKSMLFVRDDGHVGIGTANPSRALTIRELSSGDRASLRLEGWFGSAKTWEITSEDRLGFAVLALRSSANPFYGLVLREDGRVGINTDMPDFALTIQRVDSMPIDPLLMMRSRRDNGRSLLYTYQDTPNFFQVSTDASWGICFSTPNLGYTGNLLSCSDRRFKMKISPLSFPLKSLLSIQAVTYNWDQENFPEKRFSKEKQIGFIAQEVEPLLPDLVKTDQEGYKYVDYVKFVPYLLEAIKELNKRIEILETELEMEKTTNNLMFK